MILLSSHSPSVKNSKSSQEEHVVLPMNSKNSMTSQAMGAASREPRRGGIPVMTENCCQLEAFRNKKKGDPVKQ